MASNAHPVLVQGLGIALMSALAACAPQPAPMMVAAGAPPVVIDIPAPSATAMGNFTQKARACLNVTPMVSGDTVIVPPTAPGAFAGQVRFASSGNGTRAIFTGPVTPSQGMLQKAVNYAMGSSGC